jgi:hypothetical protein
MILEAMRAHSVNGDEDLVFPGIKSPYKPLSENTMLYVNWGCGSFFLKNRSKRWIKN